MIDRWRRRGALAAALALTVGATVPASPARAAPPGADAVVAFVVRGVGNGHGRGLSQWGSYGRALAGQSWQEILDAYYSNTVPGTRAGNVRVRLLGWDGAGTLGVISRPGTAGWSGGGGSGGTQYRSLYAVETSANTFSVYGSTDEYGCPGAADVPVPTVPLAEGAEGPDVNSLQQFLSAFGYEPGGIDNQFGPQTRAAVERFQQANGLTVDGTWDADDWAVAQQLVADSATVNWAELATGITGPVVFTTSANESNAAPADVLGVCRANGAVRHYRGRVELHDTAGGNRVVNQVGVENYLRGVVPQESPAAWGDGGDGAGMNALRAQAVAARSYGLALDRSGARGYFGVARTCDSPSCQVYAGSATRSSGASANSVRVEDGRTDEAIHSTAGVVREWPDGSLVVTEFSASNGARTAGGTFPAVDDARFDDQPGNPYHTWTRVIDADAIAATYGLGRADGVHTAASASMAGQGFEGIWANEVVLGNGTTVSAWDFRNAFGLRSPGFELVPVRRSADGNATLALIGDSVGVGVAGEATSPLRTLLDGAHAQQTWNTRGGRPTGGGSANWDDGADAAADVPQGTDLVVVELGYNDTPSLMPGRIDDVMRVLRGRGVGTVLWATVSERSTATDYATTNAAIRDAAGRWSELEVIDWNAASSGAAADRWFANDRIHLSTTGSAEFSLWLYGQIVGATVGRRVGAGETYEVPVLGLVGVPDGATAGAAGVAGVALNVTAVLPSGPGHIVVWDCAGARPDTSSVNFMRAGAVEPNAVVVAFDPESEGHVCIEPYVDTDVIVDVAGWFGLIEASADEPVPDDTMPDDTVPDDTAPDPTVPATIPEEPQPELVAPLHPATGRVVDTRGASPLGAGAVLRVPVLGQVGVPAGATAAAAGVAGVALNVTAVLPEAPGHLVVWDCAAPMPDTSSVNYMEVGGVEPNAVIVPFDPAGTGEVCVYAYRGTDVIVDVAGWFSATVHPVATRLLDTRLAGRLGAGAVLEVPVPDAGAGAALNVTAVLPSSAGHLTVWDCAADEPDTSSVNYAAGAVEPNAVLVPFGAGSSGTVCIRTYAETDVVVDLAGWFDAGLEPAAGRIVDTRYGVGPRP